MDKNSYFYVMPDIANQKITENLLELDRVGMTNIDLPVTIEVPGKHLSNYSAKVDAFVSLDKKDIKGIHMSRLFLILQEQIVGQELSFQSMRSVVNEFIKSHQETSRGAELRVRCDLLIERSSLLSGHKGWRSYPFEFVVAKKDDQFCNSLSFKITYSSTCPCSAALARQLIQEKFKKDFQGNGQIDFTEMEKWLGEEESICATPHSQRSYAEIKLKFEENNPIDLFELIKEAENVIGTPVQAAVKREDEQEFARLNGRNLMFCEDAARKLKNLYLHNKLVKDFWIKVEHKESLHPHNAVAVTTKGVEGGFWP